jgi:large subunit ribosomal protein L32
LAPAKFRPCSFASGTRQTVLAGKIERKCIMPNPKRRHSTRRTANRRAHDFLSAVGLSECPNCHEKKLPHRACPKCGMYQGRAVLDVKEEK